MEILNIAFSIRYEALPCNAIFVALPRNERKRGSLEINVCCFGGFVSATNVNL